MPVLSDDELKALIAACAGKEFADRRDEAIVRMFVDTGMRVSEPPGSPGPTPAVTTGSILVVLTEGQ